MGFRWIAVIALWTLFSGPIFHAATTTSRAFRTPAATPPAVKTVAHR
jgi:hypothetical protein